MWGTQIKEEALERVLERIAENMRSADRWREVYAALESDSVLIMGCFVKPVLVERLLCNQFAFDERIHMAARQQADQLRSELTMESEERRTERPEAIRTEPWRQ